LRSRDLTRSGCPLEIARSQPWIASPTGHGFPERAKVRRVDLYVHTGSTLDIRTGQRLYEWLVPNE
jgi:hypothetical protein